MNLDQRNDELNHKLDESDINEAVFILIKDAKKRKQQIFALAFTIALDIILTLCLILLSFKTSDIASQAENNKQALKRSCETTNAARANNKELWDYLLSLPPREPRTTEEQKQLDAFKEFVNKTFAEKDCNKLVN